MDRLLVIGLTGLVGSKVSSLAANYGFEAYGTHHTRQSRLPRSFGLNVTDREATLQLVRKIRPQTIINTAALTNVDYCETHQSETESVNVGGVKNLAGAARETGCRLVHISTDSVFDGKVGNYTELDTPNPLNYYSRTKLDSEKIALELESCAVARSSVVYGWVHPERFGIPSASSKTMNFALFVLDKLQRNETVKVVKDQRACPTFADNLSEALLRLARHSDNGIFHIVGRSCVSRYEFAVEIARVFGYPPELVVPVSSNDLRQIALRPKNSCLRVEKAEKTLGMQFLTTVEGLRIMKGIHEASKDGTENS